MDSWEKLISHALPRFGVFTLDDALRFGIGPETLRRRLEEGLIARLHRGVYALAGSDATYDQRAIAALDAVGPPALLAGRSAARIWEIMNASPTPVELIEPLGAATSRDKGIRVRRSGTLIPEDRAFLGPIDLTSVPRTWCDLAFNASAYELVEAGATAIHKRLVTWEDLAARSEQLPRSPGMRKRRIALGELSRFGKTDSTFERDVRRFLYHHGFDPHPGVYPLRVDSLVIAYLDIAFPSELVYLEADGFGWHALPSQLRDDHVRANEIARTEWRGIRVTKLELRENPDRFVRQLRVALDAGRRRLAASPAPVEA
jgi:hypothetical protein